VIYCKNWEDPCYVVNPTTGAIIDQFNFGIVKSTSGLAYDNRTPGGPFLWIFDQDYNKIDNSYGAKIYQYNLTAKAFTAVIHDMEADFPPYDHMAGGLFFTADFVPGTITLGALSQGVSNTMVCYEIGITEERQIQIVSIEGGFGAKTTVKNIMTQPLTNIPWTVYVSGGLILKTTGMNGVISSLAAGEQTSIKTGLILGIGHITISVNVGYETKTVTGFLFGPFILGIK